MQNGFAPQHSIHFHFPNSGPYDVNFKLTINQPYGCPQIPQQYRFQNPMPMVQFQQQDSCLTHYEDCRGGVPCERHNRTFCAALDCQTRPRLDETTLSNIPDGVASNSWAYASPTARSFEAHGVQTDPFRTPTHTHNQQASGYPGNNSQTADTTEGGYFFSNVATPPQSKVGCFAPKKHCSMM